MINLNLVLVLIEMGYSQNEANYLYGLHLSNGTLDILENHVKNQLTIRSKK